MSERPRIEIIKEDIGASVYQFLVLSRCQAFSGLGINTDFLHGVYVDISCSGEKVYNQHLIYSLDFYTKVFENCLERDPSIVETITVRDAARDGFQREVLRISYTGGMTDKGRVLGVENVGKMLGESIARQAYWANLGQNCESFWTAPGDFMGTEGVTGAVHYIDEVFTKGKVKDRVWFNGKSKLSCNEEEICKLSYAAIRRNTYHFG